MSPSIFHFLHTWISPNFPCPRSMVFPDETPGSPTCHCTWFSAWSSTVRKSWGPRSWRFSISASQLEAARHRWSGIWLTHREVNMSFTPLLSQKHHLYSICHLPLRTLQVHTTGPSYNNLSEHSNKVTPPKKRPSWGMVYTCLYHRFCLFNFFMGLPHPSRGSWFLMDLVLISIDATILILEIFEAWHR